MSTDKTDLEIKITAVAETSELDKAKESKNPLHQNDTHSLSMRKAAIEGL